MRTPFALAIAVTTLTACGGEKADNAAADSVTAAASAAPTAPPVITVTAKDFSYDAPDTVAAGMVQIKLVNQGPDLHHIQFLRLSDGKTANDFVEAIKAMKPSTPPPAWAHDVAGPNTPLPGAESSIMLNLEAGNYAMVCFIPGKDLVPHIMKGMVRPLTVVASTTPSAPAPVADINITMKDYAWDISPEITAGKHIIKLENAAEQPHEMVIAKLEAGKTPADLAAWIGKQDGPPPGAPMGGISGMSKGDVVYVPIDLAPGEYGLLCFLPDAKDGKEHAVHGMLKSFTVK